MVSLWLVNLDSDAKDTNEKSRKEIIMTIRRLINDFKAWKAHVLPFVLYLDFFNL